MNKPAAKYLYITEYSMMGDVTMTTPLEPAMHAQRVEFGTVSTALHNDTRLIALWANEPCFFALFDDSAWREGDDVPGHAIWAPIGKHWETVRMVHMGSTMRIAVRSELP